MRPIMRPAISASYQAVQSKAQPDCDLAQQNRSALETYWQWTPFPKAVIAEYKKRRLTPALPTAEVSGLATPSLSDLKTQVDTLLGRLTTAFGNPPDVAGATSDTVKAQGVDAAKADLLLVHYVEQLASVVYAGDKAINKAYPQARGDLVAGIGQYCSYCEIPMVANLAVEHMLPKNSFPRFGATWTNFLLACSACNSRKLDNPSYDDFDDNSGVDGVAQRALTSMRFPTDADYPSFDGAFRYHMQPVDIWGSPVGGPLSDTDLYTGQPRPIELVGTSVTGMLVRAYKLAIPPAPVDNAGVAALQQLAAQTVPVDVSSVPALFKACWGQASAFGTCQVVAIARNDPGALELTLIHSATYRFDTKQNDNLTITAPGGQAAVVDVKATDAKPWLLNDKVPPNILLNSLQYAYLPQVVVDRADDGPTVGVFDVTICSTYYYSLNRTNSTLAIVAAIETPVKLILAATVATAPPTQAQRDAFTKAKRTVDILDLNDANISGETLAVGKKRQARDRSSADQNNLVNRRVAWRTRTWFVARDSLWRAKQASDMAQGNPAGVSAAQFDLLLDLVAQTAKATGCWSAWSYVASKLPDLPANASLGQTAFDVKTALRQRMGAAGGLFPGTR